MVTDSQLAQSFSELRKILWSNDKRLALQFCSKKDALTASKIIGFPPKSPMSIDIMGFKIWVIADDHCRFLTQAGYDFLRADRERVA